MAARVYKYAVARTAEIPGWVVDQLRLAHELRNELVAIERDHQAAVAAAWEQDPEVAAALTEVAAATEQVDDLRERAKEERKRDRTTAPRSTTAAELKEARSRQKAAKERMREVKDRRWPAAKERMAALGEERRQRQKALYAVFVQGRGLGWATFNDVLDHHRTAVQLVARRRREGRPADMRFHRWDGTGTLAVQLQRQAGDPPRDPVLLASGEGKWRNQCQIGPHIGPDEWAAMSRSEQRRVAKTGRMLLRLAPGRTVELPIVLHRPLPPEADVALVRLTRTRTAGTHRWHVTVTCKLPDPRPVVEGTTVAVHVGWRRRADGSVRVATWRRSDGTAGTIDCPAALIEKAAHADSLRSVRDKAVDAVRDELVEWLRDHPGDDRPDPAEVARWRSPARFATLAMAWRSTPPEGGEGIAGRLEAWRKQDRHLWEWEAHERAKVVRAREDLWHRAAAEILDGAATVVVDDIQISELVRVPDVGDEDTWEARRGRAQQHMASPGALRQTICQVAARDGITVVEASAEGITSVHHACGTEAREDGAHVMWCPACQVRYDRDANAVAWLLDRASTEAA